MPKKHQFKKKSINAFASHSILNPLHPSFSSVLRVSVVKKIRCKISLKSSFISTNHPFYLPNPHFKIPIAHFNTSITHFNAPIGHSDIPIGHSDASIAYFNTPIVHFNTPFRHFNPLVIHFITPCPATASSVLHISVAKNPTAIPASLNIT